MSDADFKAIWERGAKRLEALTKGNFVGKKAGTLWLLKAEDQLNAWDNNFEPIPRQDEYFLLMEDEKPFTGSEMLWLRKNKLMIQHTVNMVPAVDIPKEHATLPDNDVREEDAT